MSDLRSFWLGRLSYDDAHQLQVTLRDDVTRGFVPPTLRLLEHEPAVTLGRRGETGDLLVSTESLSARGILLRHAERGGQATYHGPGQLVGYLIGRVRDLGPSLPALVTRIEEAMLGTCRRLGVSARRDPCQRGIWAGQAKLGFVGIAVTHGVCWHGFALNVDLDLEPFRLIRPCGLEVEVTSIAERGGRILPIERVADLSASEVTHAFGSPRRTGG